MGYFRGYGKYFSDGKYFFPTGNIFGGLGYGTFFQEREILVYWKCISANVPPVPVAGAAAGAAAGHAVGVLVAAAEPHQPVPRVVQDQRPAA